ncbi:Protein BREAST CANCER SUSCEPTIBILITY 1-like protein [Dichanthelium oligosanthes]|uniref:Protein BREAST CANCER SUSCEPTIBILITY 1-like protein n=1 Tax=Dichanthelium oligosanthes TaxID=888268 RepID=A0A1E5VB98_9POAL|nr:Protein BREAST CANCER SUSCEPTIBILITY 1-like protein [Dichanthelium oligosanthes]
MADVGSLERMGRELKCPICLSLLSSAVSITCNHIFCNGCLMESMKSSSSCPVCKVPFRRREIRPAPHMDNLVSVFKSMEAAAGTSIVSTQLAAAPTVVDGSQCGGNSSSKRKRSRKKKVASKKENSTSKATAASASCPTTKPSISTNKRIHVTPFPESETPTRPKKIMKPEEQKTKLNGDAEGDKNKTLNSDRPESPSLSPFFWLREQEEEEGGTAETLSEPLSLDTPLRHNAPTFSDIKDSDDEIPNNMTPNSKAKVSDIFDSEIFEWSQRPCSPELRSTPLKKQGKSKNILDQITETDDVEDMNLDGSFDKLDHESNAAQPVNAEEIKKRKSARTRTHKNLKLPNCGKLCTKGSDADHQVTNTPVSIAAKPGQKNSGKKARNTLSGRNKVSGNSSIFLCSSDKSMETCSPQEDSLEVEAHENQLPERSQKKNKKNRRKLEIAGDSALKTAENKSEKRSKRVRRMPDGVVADKIRVLSEAENETESVQHHTLIKGCTQHKPLDGRSKQSIESNIGPNTPSVLPGRCQFNEAISTVPSVKNVSVKNGSAKAIEKLDYSGTIRSCTARNVVLKKCEAKASKVSCAFCQSDDITEESGEMVHYHNGKQVPAEFNGGAVIHAHKNCLEWAPDVYFEEDSVFNLTTELARSRRIKCACCGIKGAALGCFEMSCRKSFHFTCARLIPECRWDNENFVMLCPLHQSSKLPIELSESKKKSQRRLTPKGPSQVRPCQDYGNNWTWPSGSPQKWVLCCSALSPAEKGIVSEFAKTVGVSISTSWNPSVTHVVTSTDLSGACKRTLKFLMAILNGKWVVSIDWVKTCMEHMEPVDEVRFEVTADVHGTSEGPRLGRQRVVNRQPKLFDGIQLYLHGEYTKSYRGYLQDLVVAAGGTVLQRKPLSRDQEKVLDGSSLILIVYSAENQDKMKPKSKDSVDNGHSQADAQALACASGGKVVSSAWIIDSIAACNLQAL